MKKNGPQLTWEANPAYDMFLSLHVLYDPEKYGLRGAWAAGVRSRLPVEEREFLQDVVGFLWPFEWIYSLPQPRDGQTVLEALTKIPLLERLPTLAALPEHWGDEINTILAEVSARGEWHDQDYAALRSAMQERWHKTLPRKEIETRLEIWAQPERFGKFILTSLQAYYEAFFAEEEARIMPALEDAIEAGQRLAKKLSLVDLLEELSQGLLFEDLPRLNEVVMVPSFWITPLVADYRLTEDRMMFVFGARPADASLVPGEFVPDALHQALKALADPTRLRILHYLSVEPQSPSGLARKLRLRAPTVVHHLHILRLARLVHLTMGAEGKRRYTARPGAVEATFAALQGFLEAEDGGEDEPEVFEALTPEKALV